MRASGLGISFLFPSSRGIGWLKNQQYAAQPERNVLCDNDIFNGDQNVLVHEMAHTIHSNLPDDWKKEVWGTVDVV